ncbi:subtilase family protein [Striga asiatica]|uniref:Subtilase family protein n=1 Tax=Striga asiatica TaxID=4170 RepID=A0A5A7PGC4_STRAF|nr:subtilase family protein [Striga asiatica]
MDNCNLLIFLQFYVLVFPFLLASSAQDRQVYIVYLGEHTGGKSHQEIEENHLSYLLSVRKLRKMEEVVSVFRSHPRKYALHTTRSWEFSGLQESTNSSNIDKNSLLYKSGYGKGVIIGVLDTGIWPESESFNDEGMDDVPKQWNGTCQTGEAFNSSNCNKKIIGARYYLKGYEALFGPINRSYDIPSARDMHGHGTHTASTAAGRAVSNASALGGFAAGTASGGAPLAHIAVYKACWADPDNGETDCLDEDFLAAFDDAIRDGVHIISGSIGSSSPYEQNGVEIGSLHAARNNIVVALSAGNAGPTLGTVENLSPWAITVGASSIDRVFPAAVVLGSGVQLQGQTVTPYRMKQTLHPLVFAGDVTYPNVTKNESGQCLPDSLCPKKAKNKIVLCLRGVGLRISKGMEVKRAGGVGFIIGNSEANGNEITVDAHVLAATHVTYEDSLRILKYINSTRRPHALITPAQTVVGNIRAPFIPTFSGKGPNSLLPQILKPDIAAPGLNILAAWSGASGPSALREDTRVVKYNVYSGTSVSSPHVSGVLALLKAVYPHWSSAALRSALMTSATVVDNEGKPILDSSGIQAGPFQLGAGVFDPNKAADPGLVYDATPKDYLLFLCGTKYKKLVLPFECPMRPRYLLNLNYPSVAIPELKSTVTVARTVTNVGPAHSVYTSSIEHPPGTYVKIWPSKLHFDHTGQKMRFFITVKRSWKFNNYSFGSYKWTDGVRVVRSPMAVSLAL